jgi:anti-sigma regulatory factor (Ser/Thr protein kinase)
MIATGMQTSVFSINDHSQVVQARRDISTRVQALGFDEVQRGKVDIIVSELATNVWLHGRGGKLLVRTHDWSEGIEIIAVDRGPGMANVSECMRDGFSTAGTAGNGLGAIRRLAHVFDIYSRPLQGTVVLAQCVRTPPPRERFLIGGVCVAVAGERECGDAWSVQLKAHNARVFLSDGLGHGPVAAQAARAAIRAIAGCAGQPLTTALEITHRAIAGTRGAAVAICDIDLQAGTVRYLGIGNISGSLFTGSEQRSMVSHNGIVGHQQYRSQEFSYEWKVETMLVMHSDGLHSRWSFEATPGLVTRHPSVIAAVLQRDHSRGRDDVNVVVMREAR